MTRRFLGYGRQTIDAADIAAVSEVLQSDFLTQGPTVERFEDALAERVGARNAVAVSNGTAALHIACLAAGLGPGDRALVPTMTFVATANAPIYCGARADLADIDPQHLSLSPEIAAAHLEQAPETAAVLPVYFAGLASDAAGLRTAAGDRTIIADACHALGGSHEDGSPVGSCGTYDMAAFSFHPVKPITTGEGGAVTTNDDELARRLRILRNHGIERDPERFSDLQGDEPGPWQYQQTALGYNYRMTDLQAALGLAQLGKLDAMVRRRREIARHYDAVLGGIDGLAVPMASVDARSRSAMHLYQISIDFGALGRSRSEVMDDLRRAGIGTQVHYIPVHRHPFHRGEGGSRAGEFPAAEKHYAETLSIPLFPSLTDEDVEFVAKQIAGILK